jgi:formimidoylglutamate deiminase
VTLTRRIEADLTWTGEQFEPGVQVGIDAGGRIADIGQLRHEPHERLYGRALMPGFVNAHSHAFQRALRGRGERFPAGAGNFWSWREAMYDLVEHVSDEQYIDLCTQAFREMLAAGITTVGEFHYFHHATDRPDFARDEATLSAANAAGIRLVLLNAYYGTGGIGQPLNEAQRHFACDKPTTYWRQMDHLAGALTSPTQSLGAVVHSIRAAPLHDIEAIAAEAAQRGMVLHMHVEEQRREIEECLHAYGTTPMAALVDRGCVSSNFTAIHCTHTAAVDMTRFLDAGGRVCVCPLTEANLGDGVPALSQALERDDRLCLGTDSNSRICMTEEMRWMEFAQRLTHEARGIVAVPHGANARVLYAIATRGGAAALGIDAGVMEPGAWADFIAIDLAAPSLQPVDVESLLDAVVFGTGNEAIADVCVGGQWRKGNGGVRGG